MTASPASGRTATTLPRRSAPRRSGPGGGAFPIPANTEILVHEYFFVVEPQASVIVHFSRWARLDLGVGYRLTAGAGALDEDLRGPSASIAVQFGGARR